MTNKREKITPIKEKKKYKSKVIGKREKKTIKKTKSMGKQKRRWNSSVFKMIDNFELYHKSEIL